jgi:hypothetical protein
VGPGAAVPELSFGAATPVEALDMKRGLAHPGRTKVTPTAIVTAAPVSFQVTAADSSKSTEFLFTPGG